MTLRKFALQMPLLVALIASLFVISEQQPVFSQSQQAYRYLKDFSYMTKDRRNEFEKAEDFIMALKRGDRRAFQIVDYDVLLHVAIRLNQEAYTVLKTQRPDQVGFLKAFMLQMDGTEEQSRATLVKASLPGIFNLDPRVRLVAASWLRVLRPDATMMRALKMAVGVDVQVIRYDRAKGDFVFTHPRIYETVASWQEYYREKDLDWPGIFAPGAIETKKVEGLDPDEVTRIGGQGTNAHLPKMVDRDAYSGSVGADYWENGGNDFIVSGLDARRWGAPNMWDKDRQWEKALSLIDDAELVRNDSDKPPQIGSLEEYYRRLNASILLAYSGVADGQLLPDGETFDDHLYPGCKPPTQAEKDKLKLMGQIDPRASVDTATCLERYLDSVAINRRSIQGRFPGASNIIVRPIIFDTVEDQDLTRGQEMDLQTNEDQGHRHAYRYYPDVLKDASFTGMPDEMKSKLRLLLGQAWMEGVRIPLGSGRMYVYFNAYGELLVGNPWVELTKLDLFVTRFVWYNKIKKGVKSIMSFVSKDTFYSMWGCIDGESPEVIPFLSTAGRTPMFNYKDVPVLLEGLRKNPIMSNRYVISRALKDIYEQKPPYADLCPAEVKKEINIALWEYQRDLNRHDAEAGKVTYHEAITVGKAPFLIPAAGAASGTGGGADTFGTLIDPYGPVKTGVATTTVADVDRVGFAKPNSEILSNSKRPIVSDCHFDTTDTCGLLDDKVVYSLDRLFKMRFFDLIGPDNRVRNYYQHRDDYRQLWRDANMKLMSVDAQRHADPNKLEWAGTPDNNLGANLALRDIEPVPAAGESEESRTQRDAKDSLRAALNDKPSGKVVDAAGAEISNTKNAPVVKTTLWEAARYVDSLVQFNITQMQSAQAFIDNVRNGSRQAFMEATWDDVESAIILTMKRLETIHRYPTSSQASKAAMRENPAKMNLPADAADSPINYAGLPQVTFFDVWDRYKVIQEYTERDPGVFTTKRYRKDAAGNFIEVTGDNYGQQIQIRKNKEFVRIAEQIRSINASNFSEEKRGNIIKSALGGLFNKDPRIRLTAIHFLRRMGPDESMLADVEKARNITASATATVETAETDDYRSAFIDTYTYRRFGHETSDINQRADYYVMTGHKYEGAVNRDVEERAKGWSNYYTNYIEKQLPDTAKYRISIPHPKYSLKEYEFNRVALLPSSTPGVGNPMLPARFYGYYQLKAPTEELEKLYKFIRRGQIVRAIKQGDVNAIRKITRNEFTILAEPVDNEWHGTVPLLSFHSTTVDPQTRKPSKLAVFNGPDVRVLKTGIDNSNFLVQKGTAEFLIRFYNFYDMCMDFKNRIAMNPCTDGSGYQPNGPYKKEIRDAMYYYIQDDIVVQEFELAFNGENPDGRAVIKAGSDLSYDLNWGGERVYLSLPERIRKDIRDAVWGDYEKLPDELQRILGIISTRAPRENVLNYYNVMLGLEPRVPWGDAGDQLEEIN